MKKFPNSIKGLRIRHQLLLLGILSFFIPLFIIGLFSVLQARRQLSERYHAQIADAALRINSTLFDITTSLYSSCENLAKTSYLPPLLGADTPVSSDDVLYLQAQDALSTLRTTTAAISSIQIYTDNPNLPSGPYITQVDNFESFPWLLTSQNKFRGDWQCLPWPDSWGNTVHELSLILQLAPSLARHCAFLVVSIDHNYMKNRLLDSDYLVMACVDNTPSFYASKPAWAQAMLPFPEGFPKDYSHYIGDLYVDGKTQLSNIITFLPYRTNNRFYIFVADGMAHDNINRITATYLFILTAATLLPLSFVCLFSFSFDKRLQTLREAMHQVRMGDYNIARFFGGDDELNEIYADLTATVQKIAENEAKFYREQIDRQKRINRQQEMEFKMLSSQINPHFLYNTLETIRMQALAADCQNVVSSIKLLGQCMHYVLENTGTDFTTLDRELSYIQSYLSIQKLRFGKRINWEIRYPDKFDPCAYTLLPLLLQPIVENAVVHGLEHRKADGMILIEMTDEPCGLLTVTVSDNGCGIPADRLAQLNERLSAPTPDFSGSIGLANISQRIRLFYGAKYGLTVTGRPEGGTQVLMQIPGRPEGENRNSSAFG